MALDDIYRHQRILRARQKIRAELADEMQVLKARHAIEVRELLAEKYGKLKELGDLPPMTAPAMRAGNAE